MAVDSLAPGDVLHARFYCRMQHQVAMNNIFYRVGGTGIGAENAALEALNAIANVFYPPLMSNVAAYYRCSVQFFANTAPGLPPAWQYQEAERFSTIMDTIGEFEDPPLPKQICGLIRKRTIRIGRGARGRIYAPFPSEGVNTEEALPVSTYVDRLQELGEALMPDTPIPFAAPDMVLVPVIFNPEKSASFEMAEITSIQASERWATQRRRGDYGAENPLPG